MQKNKRFKVLTTCGILAGVITITSVGIKAEVTLTDSEIPEFYTNDEIVKEFVKEEKVVIGESKGTEGETKGSNDKENKEIKTEEQKKKEQEDKKKEEEKKKKEEDERRKQEEELRRKQEEYEAQVTQEEIRLQEEYDNTPVFVPSERVTSVYDNLNFMGTETLNGVSSEGFVGTETLPGVDVKDFKGTEVISNEEIMNNYKDKKDKEEKEKKAVEDALKKKELSDKTGWLRELGISTDELEQTRLQLLANAYKYVGIPYKWGGTKPSGFDCSGFTQYVFKETFGVDISRTTSTQPRSPKLKQISLKDAKPGDLVYRVGQHTGIFLRNNGSNITMLHSPRPGKKLGITNYTNNVKVYRPVMY